MVTGTFDRNRRWGIEIEAFGASHSQLVAGLRAAGIDVNAEHYNHERRASWKIVGDASVQGPHAFELVSPPLKGEEGLAEVKRAMKVLKDLDCKVNRSCGLHVHHDAGDMEIDDLKAVITTWWKYEDVIQFFISPSRRAGHYCRPAAPRGGYCGYEYNQRGVDPVQAWKTAMAMIRNRQNLHRFQPDRFSAVNFHALERHGTVEFRAHQGTTDYNKIEAWIVFTQWIMTRSKQVGSKVTTRLTGAWAAETRFFFRNINWVNLTDPVVIKAKNYLRERFNEFKSAVPAPVVATERGAPPGAAREDQ